MAKCKCGNEYKVTGKSGLCIPCRRIYNKAWREKRLKLGLPVRGNASQEWWDEYLSRPDVKKRINKYQREKQKIYRNDPKLKYKYIARWTAQKMKQSGKLTQQHGGRS